MFLTYLILVVALCLSAVAAFYSIAGLTVIFSAAAVPVIIMGSILEVAKLVVTVWLHEYWQKIKLSMKLYLVPAVILLMFITSMGIFGFLSRAHVEQTAANVESQARVERAEKEIQRQQALLQRAEERLSSLQKSGLGADANVQSQIDIEQQRIDNAYKRIQPAIDEQQRIIDAQTKLYTDQVAQINGQLKTLQEYIDSGEVAKAQSMVGSRADGRWGPATAATVKAWQERKENEKRLIIQQLKDIEANNATVKSAREEIQRLRKTAEDQIADSNRLINRLREQLGNSSADEVEAAIKQQQEIVRTADNEIDRLTQEKFKLEAEFRKLEAEVGPIKYIAEFIYGDQTDKNMLEKAVRWVIVIIVAVFDPLAVMMLLAFTESRAWNSQLPQPAPLNMPSILRVGRKQFSKKQGIEDPDISQPPVVTQVEKSTSKDDSAKVDLPYLRNFKSFSNLTPVSGSTVEHKDSATKDKKKKEKNNEPLTISKLYLDDEVDRDTEEHDEHDEMLKEAKRRWKSENPDKTIKEQRRLLMTGLINRLPWLDYLPEPDDSQVAFGQVWPDNPVKGYMFLRTDYVPTKLFKFNGEKWIEINKDFTDAYTANEFYIDFLIEKIKTGEYDADLLSDAELLEIEQRLKNKGA